MDLSVNAYTRKKYDKMQQQKREVFCSYARSDRGSLQSPAAKTVNYNMKRLVNRIIDRLQNNK